MQFPKSNVGRLSDDLGDLMEAFYGFSGVSWEPFRKVAASAVSSWITDDGATRGACR